MTFFVRFEFSLLDLFASMHIGKGMFLIMIFIYKKCFCLTCHGFEQNMDETEEKRIKIECERYGREKNTGSGLKRELAKREAVQ